MASRAKRAKTITSTPLPDPDDMEIGKLLAGMPAEEHAAARASDGNTEVVSVEGKDVVVHYPEESVDMSDLNDDEKQIINEVSKALNPDQKRVFLMQVVADAEMMFEQFKMSCETSAFAAAQDFYEKTGDAMCFAMKLISLMRLGKI